jgi:hypothetical protein
VALPAATALVVLAILLATAFLPGPGAALRRVANVASGRNDPDTPDPLTTAPLDLHSLRRAAAIIGSGAFYVRAPAASPQLSAHDLPGVATLLFLPARPTTELRRADWILSYGVRPLVPHGVVARRIWHLAPSIALLEVRH